MLALIFVDMALGGLIKQIVLPPILIYMSLVGKPMKANCASSLIVCCYVVGMPIKSKLCWLPYCMLLCCGNAH